MSYYIDVEHKGLNKSRRITGSDAHVVEQRAAELQLRWAKEWEREENKELAKAISQDATEMLELLDSLLSSLDFDVPFSLQKFNDTTAFSTPYPVKLEPLAMPVKPEPVQVADEDIPPEPIFSTDFQQEIPTKPTLFSTILKTISTKPKLKSWAMKSLPPKPDKDRFHYQRLPPEFELDLVEWNGLKSEIERAKKRVEEKYEQEVAIWEIRRDQIQEANRLSIEASRKAYELEKWTPKTGQWEIVLLR